MHLLKLQQTFAGRYRVERFLAQGGMGAVYVAEHLATESLVALKVLFPHAVGSGNSLEEFKLEARVAGRIDSDHVVKVLDAGVDDETGMPFLVMELLKGQTLGELVDQGGPLPPRDVLTYLGQVAIALDKAHAHVDREGRPRPIVHRDLKPDNLFLSRRDDGAPLVKVLDFGIAKLVSDRSLASAEIKGTPAYMAYEQVALGAISPKTDVWALGLIAFHLLTGQSFWRSVSADGGVAANLAEILTHPVTTPSERLVELGRPALPAGFDAWFASCTAIAPSERFATAGEAIRRLADVLEGRGFDAPLPAKARPRPGQATIAEAADAVTPRPAAAVSVHDPASFERTVHVPAAPPVQSSAQSIVIPVHISTPPPRDDAPTDAVEPPAPSPRRDVTLPAGVPPRRSPAMLVVGAVVALVLVGGLLAFARSPAEGSPSTPASPDPAASASASPSAKPSPSSKAPAVEPVAEPSPAASPPSSRPIAAQPPRPQRPVDGAARPPAEAPARPPAEATAKPPKRTDLYGDR